MAQNATTKATTKGGQEVNVYAKVAHDGMIAIWTKAAHMGYFKAERFENGSLTASSLRKFIGVEA